MSSFWKSDPKMPIGQSSISVPSLNDLDYSPGQKITILVPKTVGFFAPEQTYLKARLELNTTIGDAPYNTLLQLNPEIGGQALIKTLRVLSGNNSTILEEVENYNTMVQLKYDYDSNNDILSKRALTEGCSNTPSTCRSNVLVPETGRDDLVTNPAFESSTSSTHGVKKTNRSIYLTLPIRSGLLSGSKIFPCLLTDGLRIEIILEDAARVIVPVPRGSGIVPVVDHVNIIGEDVHRVPVAYAFSSNNVQVQCPAFNNFGQINPRMADYTGITSATPVADAANIKITLVPGDGVNVMNPRPGEVLGSFQVTPVINQAGTYELPSPLVVAQGTQIVVGRYQYEEGRDYHYVFTQVATGDNALPGFAITNAVPIEMETIETIFAALVPKILDPANAINVPGTDSGIGEWQPHNQSMNADGKTVFYLSPYFNYPNGDRCPFIPGDTLELVASMADTTEQGEGYIPLGIVESIREIQTALNQPLIEITMTGPMSGTVTGLLHAPIAVQKTTIATVAAMPQNPSYTLHDVELCMGKIIPPPSYVQSLLRSMQENGVVQYDFQTIQNYLFSTVAGNRQATIILPLINSKAKSILCVPTESDTMAWSKQQHLSSLKPTYFNGIIDQLSNYQFVYGNKLQPDRRVSVSKLNVGIVDQQPLIELEKALVMANITPNSFRKFDSNFVIGRALALNNNTYDCANSDFQLNLSYSETAPPTKNKLWNCMVSHIRSLRFTAAGIEVVY